MILTKIPPHRLPRALAAFGAAVADPLARRVLRLITARGAATRAKGHRAVLHHKAALALARAFGMGTRAGKPQLGYSWDGRNLRTGTEAYVLLHEIAHFQIAPLHRRRRIDFGLGPGPETGDRAGAERHRVAAFLAREREEAMASLLGVLWEVELGQPGLASFLDQNWLEGAGSATHFTATLHELRSHGFVSAAGRPTRRTAA